MAHLTEGLEDSVKDTPVIHTWHAARFVRKQRIDDDPFAVSAFITHDSWLRFGNLNYVSGNITNGKPP